MKRICKNCGNVVKGNGQFCDKCGAELVEEEPAAEAVKEESSVQTKNM